ncbi:oligosaccharide flippase family protein [Infirmifilum lucidum]|uniref:Oligosaccharide flippase family protein n=1 Tax=Infirmifilum lucidum TaxID=2776706 RepID=A0A7L9FJU5_9CREN|nr:oligosaccharide flippase family protein [Infirmifilum lucidum]QOJ79283.1 oligosaccharide flippase family protein [Infirmifilum lucidum]
MAEPEYFLRGAFWLTAGQLTATLVAGIASILVARILGPDGYGLYSLSISAASLLAVFSWFGVDQATVRYASREKQKAKRYLDAAVTLAIINTLALAALGTAASRLLASAVNRPQLAQLVSLASIALAFSVLFSTSGLLTAVGRPDVTAKAGVALQLLRALLVTSLALLAGYYGAVLGHSLAYVAASLLVLAVYSRTIGAWRPTLSGLGRVLAFGIPLWLPGVIGALVAFTRTAIMGMLLSNTDIGGLAVAMNFTALLGVLVAPFSSMALPYISASNNSEERALSHVVKSSALVATPLAVYTLLYAEPLVHAVYGAEYAGAAWPLRILALQYLLPLAGSAGLAQYLVAKGDNMTVLEASVLANLVQLATVYPLTRALHALGVAATLAASQAAWLAYTALKAGVKAYTLKPLPPALLAALPAALPLLLQAHQLLKAALGLAIYAAAYAILALKTGALAPADVAVLLRQFHSLTAGPAETPGKKQHCH